MSADRMLGADRHHADLVGIGRQAAIGETLGECAARAQFLLDPALVDVEAHHRHAAAGKATATGSPT